MIAVINGVDTLISSLVAFGILLLTTLGPKLISFAADWLERHDKGKDKAEPTPEPDPLPPTTA